VSGGVPQTDAKVHLQIQAGSTNQSLKASTTTAFDEYWIITEVVFSVNSKAGNPLAEVQLQTRVVGKVFRTKTVSTLGSIGSTSIHMPFNPPIIIPKNSDIRLRALGSADNIDVSGCMNGYIAKVQQ